MLTENELKVSHIYRAKRPIAVFLDFVHRASNDRQIIWMDDRQVQYDGPAVRLGRKHPTVSKEAFLKWAAYDCTDEMPKDKSWAGWPLTRGQLDNFKAALKA